MLCLPRTPRGALAVQTKREQYLCDIATWRVYSRRSLRLQGRAPWPGDALDRQELLSTRGGVHRCAPKLTQHARARVFAARSRSNAMPNSLLIKLLASAGLLATLRTGSRRSATCPRAARAQFCIQTRSSSTSTRSARISRRRPLLVHHRQQQRRPPPLRAPPRRRGRRATGNGDQLEGELRPATGNGDQLGGHVFL